MSGFPTARLGRVLVRRRPTRLEYYETLMLFFERLVQRGRDGVRARRAPRGGVEEARITAGVSTRECESSRFEPSRRVYGRIRCSTRWISAVGRGVRRHALDARRPMRRRRRCVDWSPRYASRAARAARRVDFFTGIVFPTVTRVGGARGGGARGCRSRSVGDFVRVARLERATPRGGGGGARQARRSEEVVVAAAAAAELAGTRTDRGAVVILARARVAAALRRSSARCSPPSTRFGCAPRRTRGGRDDGGRS